MYDELVKRLRASVDGRYEKCDCCPYEEDYPCCVDCLDKMHKQAADAIEDLQADKAALNGTVTNLLEQIKDLGKPKWIPVTEALPKSGGSYIVYLRPFKGKTDLGYVIGDLSYPTEMYFDKGQMLWVGENESYNAILSAVDTENEYHVTHWMKMPEAPKEE